MAMEDDIQCANWRRSASLKIVAVTNRHQSVRYANAPLDTPNTTPNDDELVL